VGQPFAASVNLSGTEVPVYRLLVIVISLLVYILIQLFLNRTIFGKAIRRESRTRTRCRAWDQHPSHFYDHFRCRQRPCRFRRLPAFALGRSQTLHGFDMLLLAFVTVILGVWVV